MPEPAGFQDAIAKAQKGEGRRDDEDEDEIDTFIKSKLLEWDKNADGIFTVAECKVAVEELRKAQSRQMNLKWFVVKGVFATIALLAVLLTAVAIVFVVLGRSFAVTKDSEMTDVSSKQSMRLAKEETHTSMTKLIMYDKEEDEWMITDSELRKLMTISFIDNDGTFHWNDIASITRKDASSNDDDFLEILTESGNMIWFDEAVGQDVIEVQFAGSNETVYIDMPLNDDGRRLQEVHSFSERQLEFWDLKDPLLDEPPFSHDREDDEMDDLLPPRGRRTKGVASGGSSGGRSGGAGGAGRPAKRTVIIGAAAFHGHHQYNYDNCRRQQGDADSYVCEVAAGAGRVQLGTASCLAVLTLLGTVGIIV